jgi:hypothetical protein
MFTLFKKTIEKTFSIEQYVHEEQAISRMEYLGLNNLDENAMGYFVESGDNRLVAEWEV